MQNLRFSNSAPRGCATRKKAFTLIELLVVVSIIALLVSILLPALSRAREQAKAVLCLSNMRQAQLALMYYLDENDHYFPQCDTMKEKQWHEVFAAADYEFAGNRCPCSRNTGVSTDLITYAYNQALGSNLARPWGQRRRTSGLEDSAAKIITFCESYKSFFWNWQNGQGEKCGEPWDGRRGIDGRLVFHHNDGQNLSFLDGHVEYRNIATLSFEDWSVDY